jgi:hypothetical protein
MTMSIYRASNGDEALRQGEILAGVVSYKPSLTLKETHKETQEINDPQAPGTNDPKIQEIKDKIGRTFKSDCTPIFYPYAIIINQNCDLDWDYNARKNQNQPNKLLNSILLCEVFSAKEIRYDKKYSINTKEWDFVKSNRHQQYHFFEKVPPECTSNQEELPELTVDFKRIFAVDADFLYFLVENNIAKRCTVLNSPYLEHFSHHYYAFHGRVALPAQHESQKEG